MRISSGMILVAACCQTAFASVNWPNEPAGSAVVMDCPFTNSICPPLGGNSTAYATFSDAPLSPPYVFDTYLAAGSGHGNGQWDAVFPNLKEIYVGTWWSTNADFMGLPNNTNKMFFVACEKDNNFLVWQGAPGQPKTLKWYNQATYDNCGHPGETGMCYSKGDGTGWFEPNSGQSNGIVAAGSGWHRIEVYLKASTTTTSRDGIVRWWLDGLLVGNYPTVNLSPGGFQSFSLNHTWDGSGGDWCAWRDCSKSWHHYWDQFHISVPNGAALVPTSIRLSPLQTSAEKNRSLQFTATVLDQNGFPLVNQPAVTWATTGSNTIANGLFWAGNTTGDFTVTASAGSISASTTVKVMDFVAVNLKINCGDNSPAVPGWEPDLPYLVSGQTGEPYDFIGTFSTAGVANAAPAALYSTVRHYNHAFSFPACPNGNYLVRMHFSDKPAAGRAMDYTIEGIKVIDNMDIMKEAGGAFKAMVKEFNVVVSDNNGLQIAGNQDAGNDVFEAGIEIIRNGTSGTEARRVIGSARNGIQISAPGNGRIAVQAPGMQEYSVTVYDCEGRSKAIAFAKGMSSPVISGLRNGVYFVKVQGMGENQPAQYGQVMLMR